MALDTEDRERENKGFLLAGGCLSNREDRITGQLQLSVTPVIRGMNTGVCRSPEKENQWSPEGREGSRQR